MHAALQDYAGSFQGSTDSPRRRLSAAEGQQACRNIVQPARQSWV